MNDVRHVLPFNFRFSSLFFLFFLVFLFCFSFDAAAMNFNLNAAKLYVLNTKPSQRKSKPPSFRKHGIE